MSKVPTVNTNPLQAIGALGVHANGKAPSAQGSSTAPINSRAPQNQDPLAAIAALTGGKSSQGTKGVSTSAPKRIDKPEKIDNLYDLKTAVEAGQIEKISVCDLNAVAEFKNNKSHYVVKFTTSKGEGHKTHKFDVGEFVSPNQLEELQRVSVGNKVTFKSERIDPNVEGLKQIGLVLLPPVVGALIWISSMLGIKAYKTHEFKGLIKEKLITNPDQLGLEDVFKIKLGDLKDKLPGYGKEIRDYLSIMGISLESISKMTPEQLETETGNFASLTLTGWAGTGKTSIQQLIDWNLLKGFQDSKVNFGILNLNEVYKGAKRSEGDQVISLPNPFQLSPAEEARLIFEVCNDLGINFVRLRMDDGNHGSQADSLRKMADLNKFLFDEIQANRNKKKEPIGFFNKLTHFITNIFNRNNDTNSYSLRSVCVGVSSNADLEEESNFFAKAVQKGVSQVSSGSSTPEPASTSEEFDAILRRFGKIIKIDKIELHDRFDMIKHLLKLNFPGQAEADYENIALYLTQITKASSPNVKSIPVSAMKSIVETLKTIKSSSLAQLYNDITKIGSSQQNTLHTIVENELGKRTYVKPQPSKIDPPSSRKGLDEIIDPAANISDLISTLISDISTSRNKTG